MKGIIKIVILFCILPAFGNLYSQDLREDKKDSENENITHEVDTFRNVLKVWNLPDNINESPVDYNDSLYTMFHQYEKDRKYSVLTTNLGEIASAYISDIYFDRHNRFDEEFIFKEAFKVYMKNSESTRYFNTRRPYTSITHTTSTKINDIQTIDFTHTQNVHPNLNFAINFDFISSQGQFLSPKKRISTIEVTSNYRKKRYNLYASYIFNKINNENTGGYNFENDPPAPLLSSNPSVTATSTVNFTSTTLIQNQEISFTNKYKFGSYKNLSYQDSIIKVLEPTVSLSHNIKLFRNFRKFTDEEDSAKGYYSVFRYQEGYTIDSVAYKGLVNKIMLSTEKNFEEIKNFGFHISLASNYNQYYNFKEYIFLYNKKTFWDNSFDLGFFSKQIKHNTFRFNGIYYFSGYRKNDMKLELNYEGLTSFQKFPDLRLQFDFSYTNKKPSYFINSFYSNHYAWDNNFLNIKTYKSGISLEIPKYKASLNINSALISNYIYYKQTSETIAPIQHPEKINIVSASLEKKFVFKSLEIHNRIIGQKTTNDSVVSLPEFAGYHSTFLKFTLKNSMMVHFGYGLYYSTKYNAKGFDPAIGLFHIINNPEESTGEYPYINLFANMRIKRSVMLYFKFEHVNSGLFGELYPVFISGYPIAARLFRFGVQWKFTN